MNNFTSAECTLIKSMNSLLCQDEQMDNAHFIKMPLSTIQLFVTSMSCYYARCVESKNFCNIIRSRGGNGIKVWAALAKAELPENFIFSRPFSEIDVIAMKKPLNCFTYFDAAVIQGRVFVYGVARSNFFPDPNFE